MNEDCTWSVRVFIGENDTARGERFEITLGTADSDADGGMIRWLRGSEGRGSWVPYDDYPDGFYPRASVWVHR